MQVDLPDAMISTRLLTRLIILLIGIWSFAAGLVLLGFASSGGGALGAGIADPAGQRLVGVHLLLLTPVYALIVLRPERYQVLMWLPFAAQLALALTVAYNMLAGSTSVGDGILASAISAIFAGCLGFVWATEQRSMARAKLEAQERDEDARLPHAHHADDDDEEDEGPRHVHEPSHS
jgi:hypothetical protein